jgi:hypothetical protein
VNIGLASTPTDHNVEHICKVTAHWEVAAQTDIRYPRHTTSKWSAFWTYTLFLKLMHCIALCVSIGFVAFVRRARLANFFTNTIYDACPNAHTMLAHKPALTATIASTYTSTLKRSGPPVRTTTEDSALSAHTVLSSITRRRSCAHFTYAVSAQRVKPASMAHMQGSPQS